MEAAGALETLAEVSVALAGFSSILVALRRGPAEPSRGAGSDLFMVVGGSLLVTLFSLLPLALHHLGLGPQALWRFQSILLAVVLAISWLIILRLRANLLGAGLRPSFPTFSAIAVHSPLLLVIFLLLSAFDLLVPGAYLLALIALLMMSALPLVLSVLTLTAGFQK